MSSDDLVDRLFTAMLLGEGIDLTEEDKKQLPAQISMYQWEKLIAATQTHFELTQRLLARIEALEQKGQ
jgi:hypothetical protein